MNALRSASALALLAASALAAGCGARFQESRQIDVPAVADSALEIATENGSITIEAVGSPGSVKIDAEIFATSAERAAAVKIVAERRSPKIAPTSAEGAAAARNLERDAVNTLVVRAEWPEGGRESNEGCSFKIRLPDAKWVDATSSNGSIHVVGTLGAVKASTQNGSIEITRATGPVQAKTSNGSVKALLDDANPGPANLETSNGSIRLAFGPAFHGALTAETDNGRVELVGFDARAGDTRKAKEASLTIGVGGETSHLETSNGSIRIESAAK